MNSLKRLMILCLLSVIAPTLLSAESLHKMSVADLFEKAIEQIPTNRNYHRQVKQQTSNRGGHGAGKSSRKSDLPSYSIYRDEIISRGSNAEKFLKSRLTQKENIEVLVIATAIQDRIKYPDKYMKIEKITQKISEIAQRNILPPHHFWAGQAHGIITRSLNKSDKNGTMMEMGRDQLPEDIVFTKDTSIAFLCETALTGFNPFSLILLGQFKNSELAKRTLYHVYENIAGVNKVYTLEGIALIGDMATVRKALKNSNAHFRQNAAEFLGRAKDANSVNALILTLGDSNNQIKSAAIKSLGQIGDKKALPILTQTFVAPDVEMSIQHHIGRAIANIDFDVLLSYAKNKNQNIRFCVVNNISRRKKPVPIEILLFFLTDDYYLIREIAVGNLERYSDIRAVEPLIERVRKDESVDVRVKSIRALRKLKDPRAVKVLITALDDSNKQVKKEAHKALGALSSIILEKKLSPAEKKTLDDAGLLYIKKHRKPAYKAKAISYRKL